MHFLSIVNDEMGYISILFRIINKYIYTNSCKHIPAEQRPNQGAIRLSSRHRPCRQCLLTQRHFNRVYSIESTHSLSLSLKTMTSRHKLPFNISHSDTTFHNRGTLQHRSKQEKLDSIFVFDSYAIDTSVNSYTQYLCLILMLQICPLIVIHTEVHMRFLSLQEAATT